MERTEILKGFYGAVDEGTRLSRSRQGQLEYRVTTHFLQKYLAPGCKVLETGAGTGRYSVALAQAGFRVSALELLDCNYEKLRRNAEGVPNLKTFKGDALDLSAFGEEEFDSVLLFGPMYHLYETSDREKAITEALRVTKPGGYIFAAFLSAHAIICTNYLYKGHPATLGIKENFDENYNTRHFKEQLFTGYDVCEFEEFFAAKGLEHVTTAAVDSVLEIAERRADFCMSDEDFEAFADYQLHICEKREMLGCSSHLLYIGRKK